jgi:hypothetical protein
MSEHPEDLKDMDFLLDRIARARAAIEEHAGKWQKGHEHASNGIDCPVCQVKLALTYCRTASNGHIYARCRTPGCVCWME